MEEKYVDIICKSGKGPETCRYLAMSGGFRCVKLDPGLKTRIDQRVADGTFNAKGDNCPGKPYDVVLSAS